MELAKNTSNAGREWQWEWEAPLTSLKVLNSVHIYFNRIFLIVLKISLMGYVILLATELINVA